MFRGLKLGLKVDQKSMQSHQPFGLGWFRVGCLFSTPLLSTLLVSTLWGGVISLFPINNNPSPSRRTINPTPFGPSPPALSKIHIFLWENQYFAIPGHHQTLLCFQKMLVLPSENQYFCFQCITALLLAPTGAIRNVDFPLGKPIFCAPRPSNRPSSVPQNEATSGLDA